MDKLTVTKEEHKEMMNSYILELSQPSKYYTGSFNTWAEKVKAVLALPIEEQVELKLMS